jgi:hypothetical protein
MSKVTISAYMWNPQEDITVFELALALKMFVNSGILIDLQKVFNSLPPNVQRHFKVVEDK